MGPLIVVTLTVLIVILLYLITEWVLKRLSKECRKEYRWFCWFVHRIYCAEKEGCPFQHAYSRLLWILSWVLVGIIIDRVLMSYGIGKFLVQLLFG